MHVPLPLMIY